MKYLAVAFGGAFGAIFRFLLNQILAGIFAPFPTATFLINITGSLAIGFLFALATERAFLGENLRLFLTVGFLGAYTTFSTFEFETFTLASEKKFLLAMLYVIASVLFGFLGVYCGVWVGKKI